MNRNTPSLARRARAGFTLLEMMLVVLIIGMLVAGVAWSITAQGDKAKVRIAGKDIHMLSSAVDSFYLDKGQYPVSLQALVDAKFIAKVSKDPWRKDFVYYTPAQDGKPYALFSMGPDGQAGTPDDINVWTLDQEPAAN